jgi:hypothetical protein
MNPFTPEEIQDLEDAIYFAAEHIAWKQENFLDYSKKELGQMSRYLARIMKLKARLSKPDMTAGGTN